MDREIYTYLLFKKPNFYMDTILKMESIKYLFGQIRHLKKSSLILLIKKKRTTLCSKIYQTLANFDFRFCFMSLVPLIFILFLMESIQFSLKFARTTRCMPISMSGGNKVIFFSPPKACRSYFFM